MHGCTVLVLIAYWALPTDNFKVAGTHRIQSIEVLMETASPATNLSVSIEPPSKTQPKPLEPSSSPPERRPAALSELGTQLVSDAPVADVVTIDSAPPQRADTSERSESESQPMAHVSLGRTHRVPVIEQRIGYEEAPDLSRNSPPKYPPDAIRRRLEGVVLLRLFIDEAGDVRVVKLLESSGHQVLDQAAITAVASWTGTPATRNGRPVDALEVLPIRFRL